MSNWSLPRHFAGILFFSFFAVQSWANPTDLIEVTGLTGWSCGTGTGGFEGRCGHGENVEKGPFDLIYDPLIPDSDDRDTVGVFRGAITQFTMTVRQSARPDLLFTLVGRGDILLGYASDGAEAMTWRMTLSEANNAFAPSAFYFNMYFSGWPGDVNQSPNIENLWYRNVTGYVAGGGGVSETDWLYSGSLIVTAIPRPMPVPGTPWLCLTALAALGIRRLRRRRFHMGDSRILLIGH